MRYNPSSALRMPFSSWHRKAFIVGLILTWIAFSLSFEQLLAEASFLKTIEYFGSGQYVWVSGWVLRFLLGLIAGVILGWIDRESRAGILAMAIYYATWDAWRTLKFIPVDPYGIPFFSLLGTMGTQAFTIVLVAVTLCGLTLGRKVGVSIQTSEQRA